MNEQDKEAFDKLWNGPDTCAETKSEYWSQYYKGIDVEMVAYRFWQAALNYERERLRENTHVEYECDNHNYLGPKPCPYCEKDLEGWL